MADNEKFGNLIADHLSSFISDSADCLLDGSCVRSHMKRVLGQFSRDTRQSLIWPCKDILILTEKLDERAFLFAVQPGTNDDGALRVGLINADFLGLLGGLKRRARLRVGQGWASELS